MISSALLLQYLLYMNPSVGLPIDFARPNVVVFDDGANLRSRVGTVGSISLADIDAVLAYLSGEPFSWFVAAQDTASNAVLAGEFRRDNMPYCAMAHADLHALPMLAESNGVQF